MRDETAESGDYLGERTCPLPSADCYRHYGYRRIAPGCGMDYHNPAPRFAACG